jgi:hypothetical protein
MFYAHPDCDVRVYFDGPEAAQRSHGANVREIYSGGAGDHRADNAILADLDYLCATMSAMPRLLVTDDRELAAAAAKRNTRIMRSLQFGALLEDIDP